MNVKIESKTITFKIAAKELQDLRSGAERIEIELPVGQRSIIAAALVCDPTVADAAIDLATDNREACLTLRIPAAMLDRLGAMGRDRDGIRLTFPDLSVVLQLDLRTRLAA